MTIVRQTATAIGFACLLSLAWVSHALADDGAISITQDERNRSGHVTLFASRWAETNLLEIPGNVVTNKLNFDDAYFVGIAGSLVWIDNFDTPLPFAFFNGMDLEVEMQVLQHFNLEDHTEGTLALVLRSGEMNITENFSFNIAFGEGISYAFTAPDLEHGKNGIRGVDTYKFENLLLFELELAHKQFEQVHLVGRIHHRSGGYGLITPRNTGSNYLGLGLRYDFE